MGIDVRKFIDVNIQNHTQSSVISVRDTAVLITNEGTDGNTVTVSSLSEWNDYISGLSFTNTTPYVNTFFTHGGAKLMVVEGKSGSYATQIEDKYIVVAVVGQTLAQAKSLATTFDTSLKGAKRKMLLARAKNSDLAALDNVLGIDSLAVKYSEVIAAEMTIAAYLTRIKIFGTNSVHDYAFTSESVQADTTVVVDDALFDTLQQRHVNFNLALAGATRNIGGNMTSGRSLVNEYMLIVLHQTMSDQLLALLVTKIKGNKALSAMRTVLSQELNRYVQNGFLTTSKMWTSDAWTVVHNGLEFTIIEKDTPLSLGYHIQILPWTALTDQQKAEYSAPPIYVVIADSYGVRKIELVGEVI